MEQLTDIVIDYIKELRDTCSRLDSKLDMLTERIAKLEIAFQNLSHIDASTIQRVDAIDIKYDDAIKRVHKRIDDVVLLIKENTVNIGKIEHSPIMLGNSLIKSTLDKIILVATGGVAMYIVNKVVAGFHG